MEVAVLVLVAAARRVNMIIPARFAVFVARIPDRIMRPESRAVFGHHPQHQGPLLARHLRDCLDDGMGGFDRGHGLGLECKTAGDNSRYHRPLHGFNSQKQA